jgi:hypothetical protein
MSGVHSTTSTGSGYYSGFDSERIQYLQKNFLSSDQKDIDSQTSKLGLDGAVELRALSSDDRLFLTNTHFYWAFAEAGKGGSTTAYHTRSFPLNGDEVSDKVLKVSRHRFEPQRRSLENLSPNSKTSKEIDHFQGVYRLGKASLAVCEPSDCDLRHVDYTRLEKPATSIIHQLKHFTGGLGSLHRRDLISCDVKGGNLLFNWGKPGKVTDFNLLRKISDKPHPTRVTPVYAAPFIWSSLEAQYHAMTRREPNKGLGLQTKGADIFSLGRTIQLDVLNRLIQQFAKKYDLEIFTKELGYLRLEKSGSEETLDALLSDVENSYEGRVFCGPVSDEYIFRGYVFSAREEVYEKTLTAIDQLEAAKIAELDAVECAKLRELANLAMGLQASTRMGVCQFLGYEFEEENVSDRLVQEVGKMLGRVQKMKADDSRVGALRCSCRKGLFGSEDTDSLEDEVVYNPRKNEREEDYCTPTVSVDSPNVNKRRKTHK